MALRTLATRLGTSAAAVRLRTPALGLSPPPAGRPNLYSAAATRLLSPPSGCRTSSSHVRTKIDLKSASIEELEHEAAFLRGRIDEVMESISKEKERSSVIMKDLWGTMKLMGCWAVVVKVITFVISPIEEAEEMA